MSDCREGCKEASIRKSIPKRYRWREPREIQTFGEVQKSANDKLLSNLSPVRSLPDEPIEDDGARATTVEVSEGAEEGGDADGVVRHTVFRARFEDAWRGALDGEGVEAAAGNVEEAVT
jgi:hypothetical protein